MEMSNAKAMGFHNLFFSFILWCLFEMIYILSLRTVASAQIEDYINLGDTSQVEIM